MKEPEWIAHQPFGQMPWMEDSETGIELFESRAIVACKFILIHVSDRLTRQDVAAKIKSPLAPGPDDLAAYAKYQQAAQNEPAQFDIPASILAWELVFVKMSVTFLSPISPQVSLTSVAVVSHGLMLIRPQVRR